MKPFTGLAFACCVLMCAAQGARADESGFLNTFKGNWTGTGIVKLTTATPTVNVSCKFGSSSTSSSLSLDGVCRGLVLFSRNISAHLKVSGAKYVGTYIGSRTGPAGLNGRRSGNTLNLAIRWAQDVNGDRDASLTIRKTGSTGMQLTVTDVDHKTGRNVVLSRIDLSRV